MNKITNQKTNRMNKITNQKTFDNFSSICQHDSTHGKDTETGE